MSIFPHRLDRTVTIGASRETVFRFFTDPARWASWWGAGSHIDARAGGEVKVRHPNGIEFLGVVREIAAPERIVFTYADAGGSPIPKDGSLVTIRPEAVEGRTRVHLTHEFAEESVRDQYVQGWRFQLSLFGNIVANEVQTKAGEVVDAWYSAWVIADAAERERVLAGIASQEVRFRDRFSLLDGLEEVNAHIGASQRFMPGVRLQRRGSVRHCQGTVLSDWVAVDVEGKELMAGTSVFSMGPGGEDRRRDGGDELMRSRWVVLLISMCGTGSACAAEPETVIVTLHAKAGAESELARVIARHWEAVRRLQMVSDAPHVTLRGAEDGDKTYFVEIVAWRDASIPDTAPAEIQAIWKEMNELVEARDGKPGLDFRAVSVLAGGP